MNTKPHSVEPIVLLKWVVANQMEAFDPNMVVQATHTSDWEWQAVANQMEELRRQGYLSKVRQDPWGSTYWTITQKGLNYLHAFESFESQVSSPPSPEMPKPPTPEVTEQVKSEGAAAPAPAPEPPQAVAVTEPPLPLRKKHIGPLFSRMYLWIGRWIQWEEMPTHLTAHLAYDVLKYLVFGGALTIIAALIWAGYHLFHWLIHWVHTIKF